MPTSKPINVSDQIQPLDYQVELSPSVQGWQIPLAPYKLTTALTTDVAGGVYAAGTQAIIDNHTTVLRLLLAALQKENLIKP